MNPYIVILSRWSVANSRVFRDFQNEGRRRWSGLAVWILRLGYLAGVLQGLGGGRDRGEGEAGWHPLRSRDPRDSRLRLSGARRPRQPRLRGADNQPGRSRLVSGLLVQDGAGHCGLCARGAAALHIRQLAGLLGWIKGHVRPGRWTPAFLVLRIE